jgi:hypothetical protein
MTRKRILSDEERATNKKLAQWRYKQKIKRNMMPDEREEFLEKNREYQRKYREKNKEQIKLKDRERKRIHYKRYPRSEKEKERRRENRGLFGFYDEEKTDKLIDLKQKYLERISKIEAVLLKRSGEMVNDGNS